MEPLGEEGEEKLICREENVKNKVIDSGGKARKMCDSREEETVKGKSKNNCGGNCNKRGQRTKWPIMVLRLANPGKRKEGEKERQRN